MNNRLPTRRAFPRVAILFLASCLLLSAQNLCPARSAPSEGFVVGVNYPWAAYGHDFGGNGWGHDGVVTGGWTYQTFQDSQGFTDAKFSKTQAHGGTGSLAVTADLVGGHPNRARGEVYVDLKNHPPRGVSVPLNLRNVTAHCWLFLPPGSAGNPQAPNGVQLIFKSEGFFSLYGPFQNIKPEWEGRWVEFTANASSPAGFVDAQYDPRRSHPPSGGRA